MANLPYTDGSNGNGITDIKELLTYYGKCPLAFLAYGFTDSYHSLFTQINPNVVLSLFDKVITPEELDHFPALQLADKPLEILGIRFCLSRFLSEGVLLSARHDRDWDMGAMLFNLKLQSLQQYPLCVKCSMLKQLGRPPIARCNQLTVMKKKSTGTFSQDNSLMICCAASQIFQRLKGSVERQRAIDEIGGLEPGSCASCRLPRATKTCAKCLHAKYCGNECQKKHWSIHKSVCRSEEEEQDQAAAAALS